MITFTTAEVGGNNDTSLGISIAQRMANIVGYVKTLIGLSGSDFLFNVPNASAETSLQTAFAFSE